MIVPCSFSPSIVRPCGRHLFHQDSNELLEFLPEFREYLPTIRAESAVAALPAVHITVPVLFAPDFHNRAPRRIFGIGTHNRVHPSHATANRTRLEYRRSAHAAPFSPRFSSSAATAADTSTG